MIYIHKGKFNTLIFMLLWFGLSHWYNIQDNTCWLSLIVLNFVKSFVWYCSFLTQYSYYRDLYCSWPSSHLFDCAIVGYSLSPVKQLSEIFWSITITVWLKSQFHRVTFFFLMHDIFTPQNIETHNTVILGEWFWTTGIFKRLAYCRCILHCAIILPSE